jgi:hypothetical protein
VAHRKGTAPEQIGLPGYPYGARGRRDYESPAATAIHAHRGPVRAKPIVGVAVRGGAADRVQRPYCTPMTMSRSKVAVSVAKAPDTWSSGLAAVIREPSGARILICPGGSPGCFWIVSR